MATTLDKDLIRESTVTSNERNILVTLGADQIISFKLKGMKSGVVSISIEELYKQLAGIEDEVKSKSITVPTGGSKKQSSGDPMISLHDIRHRLNVSAFDYPTTVKFDAIMNDLIEETQKK
jgi:hypothetical protein